MPIINTERFVDALVNSPALETETVRSWDGTEFIVPRRAFQHHSNLRSRIARALGRERGRAGIHDGTIYTAQFDRESALRVYSDIKEYIKERGTLDSKELRPWHIDPTVYSSLDQNEPWLGFEFETGWRDQAARAEAIEHCWNTWDNVVFDSEGEGTAPVEITFAPQELSKYLDGTADSYKFVEYLNGNRNIYQGPHMMVGTHVNISLPFMRAFSRGDNAGIRIMDRLSQMMGRTMGTLGERNTTEGDAAREKYFGRSSLYAGAYPGDGMTWMEFKVFRTTYSLDKFKQYLATSRALVRCLQALYDNSENFTKKYWHTYYVSNLVEMIEDENVAPVFASEPCFTVDFNGAHNNGYYYDDEEDDEDWRSLDEEEDEDWEPDDEPEPFDPCTCDDCVRFREDTNNPL